MKNRCYPKCFYVLYIILSAILFLFAAAPLFIKTDDELLMWIIWSTSMTIFGIITLIGAIYYMQYYYFEDDNIIVKSLFGIVVKLDVNKVNVYIEMLPTYLGARNPIDVHWICIYDESISDNFSYKFKSGGSNKRKYKRIQIIYTDNNWDLINQHIKITPRTIF